MTSTVPEIIDAQVQQANNYVTQATGFINAVANLANTEFNVVVPASLGFGLTDYTDDALDKINNLKPTRPTFEDIEVLSPTAPVIAFADIDQEILDAVKAKLLSDIENGGYGIEPDDEAALWQRERDREDQNGLAVADEITRQFAEGGFPIPTGAMFNAQAAALQQRQAKNAGVNRDIALKRADMYVENRRFALQQGGQVQQILIQLHQLFIGQAQALTSIFASQIAKYRADVEAEVETLRSNLGIYSADVQAFSVGMQAIAEAYRLKTSEQQLNNNWNVEVVKTKLEEARVKLQGMQASGLIRNSAAQFGAQYYMGAITAALGSINTLAAQTTTE